ncbi:hypothetical protein C4588_05660 [Candidatus Parcubacteria bacterium]|nr:MAG: hypothetical protein C4588_05660 [Candidatus Parcubacteria bacterium]
MNLALLARAAKHNPQLFSKYFVESGLLDFLSSDVNKVISNPIAIELASQRKWVSDPEIDLLHFDICKLLGIDDVYRELTWKFNKRFTSTFGQAEYKIVNGIKQWHVQYTARYWMEFADQDRKNLITHEICHLAVERLYGHGTITEGRRVTDHGYHWKKLMEKCGEDPHLVYNIEIESVESFHPLRQEISLELIKLVNDTQSVKSAS